MRIKSLMVKNFRNVGDKGIYINFAPLTLLFGPNNIGKSTIIKALHLAHEFFCATDPDFDNIPNTNLGSFADYVYGHDLDRKITLELTLANDQLSDVSSDYMQNTVFNAMVGFCKDMPEALRKGTGLPEKANWNMEYDTGEKYFSSALREYFQGYKKIKTVAVYFCIARQKNKTRVENFGIRINTEPYLQITVKEEDKKLFGIIEEYNPCNLVVLNKYYDRATARLPDYEEESRKITYSGLYEIPLNNAGVPNWNSQYVATVQMEESERKLENGRVDTINMTYRITDPEVNFVNTLLGPCRAVRNLLKGFIHLGPLRAIPPRGSLHRQRITKERWYNGLAGWDALLEMPADELEKINKILNGYGYLDTGFQIIREPRLSSSISSPLYEKLSSISQEEIDMQLAAEIRNLMAHNTDETIRIRNIAARTNLQPCDMGVGISQVFPVIAGAMTASTSIVAVEQPELHIHPAWQTALADIFILAKGLFIEPKIILVETHSEHLVLRLLRRIRETSAYHQTRDIHDLPKLFLNPQEIAIYWIGKYDGHADAFPIDVDEDGTFCTPWPEGFFDERVDEL